MTLCVWIRVTHYDDPWLAPSTLPDVSPTLIVRYNLCGLIMYVTRCMYIDTINYSALAARGFFSTLLGMKSTYGSWLCSLGVQCHFLIDIVSERWVWGFAFASLLRRSLYLEKCASLQAQLGEEVCTCQSATEIGISRSRWASLTCLRMFAAIII